MIGLLIIFFVLIIIFIFNLILNSYIEEHCNHIKEIKNINNKYNFHDVLEFNFVQIYDNEHSYFDITPLDYLIYQLIFIKKSVKEEIRKTNENSNLYHLYIEDLKVLKSIELFDIQTPKYIILLTKNKIKRKIKNLKHNPKISFKINVKLIRTTINGRKLKTKSASFGVDTVEHLIEKLYNKTYDRYNDQNIWNSICKVERGKVSNKMRFSIYQRDGHRCRKCGRHTKDLEIDHIIPISKGGKSTYDNLQTLCKSCNMKKSNIVESVHFNNKQDLLLCPKCGAPLKLKKGKYGSFLGCINYPRCTYIKK